MCTGTEHLTPAARELVASLLGQIAERLADDHGCQPGDVVIGPVDLGPANAAAGAGAAKVGDRRG